MAGEMTAQAPTSREESDIDFSDPPARPIPDPNVNAAIQTLSSCLKESQSGSALTTAPAGFDDALYSLSSSDCISQAFQLKGFWTWLAYFLATKDTVNCDALSQTLSGFSPDTLSYVAAHVSQVKAETSLTQRIEHTLWVAKRGSQRRAQLQQTGILDFPPKPSITPSSPSEPNPRKRPRIQSSNCPNRTTDVTVQSSSYNMVSDTTQRDIASTVGNPSASQQNEEVETFDDTSLLTFNIDSRYTYAYPNAGNIPSVFNQDLGDIIVRNGYNASIFLSFPTDPSRCRLVLDIEASEVVHLAMKLYGAEIVKIEQERQRAFKLQSGANVEIMGTAKLRKTKPKQLQAVSS
ncbi:hypothetical protein ACKLNR_014573 [Fusarium oxysporum f. sp. zingiberi]